MEKKIYIGEDDREARESIISLFEREGFMTMSFETGDALLKECSRSLPDLVLADTALSGTDGLSCCAMLRKDYPDLAIMLLSDKDSPYDRITALGLGTDDYVAKPFHPLELVMRVRALLRRCGVKPEKQQADTDLVYGPLTLYSSQQMSINNGQPVSLAPGEFNFLSYLVRKPGHAVSREEILKVLWHRDGKKETRVDTYLVKRLRKKLSDAGSPVTIETVWGYGFRLGMSSDQEKAVREA